MSIRVYEKTDKGREEIATRLHHLPVRLRSVLVMIDGRRPVSELMPHLEKLGLDKTSFDELVAQEFIHSLPCSEDDVVEVAPVVARVPPGLRRMHKLHGGAVKLNDLDLVSVNGVIDVAPEAAPQPVPAPSVFAELPAGDEERFKSVHRFYNETIRGNLGLRGFALQLKVERADTLDDLRALRAPYLEAVKKTKGNEMAQALDARLLSLLAEPVAA